VFLLSALNPKPRPRFHLRLLSPISAEKDHLSFVWQLGQPALFCSKITGTTIFKCSFCSCSPNLSIGINSRLKLPAPAFWVEKIHLCKTTNVAELCKWQNVGKACFVLKGL